MILQSSNIGSTSILAATDPVSDETRAKMSIAHNARGPTQRKPTKWK